MRVLALLCVFVLSLTTALAVSAYASCGGEEGSPKITVHPTSLHFSSKGQKKSVTITNSGTVTWEFSKWTITPEQFGFTSLACFFKTYEPEDSCVVEVELEASGSFNGEFILVTDVGVEAEVELTS